MRPIQLFYLFLTIFISGCWAATIPHEVPKSLGDPDMLEPLIGQHYKKVIEVLGPPDQDLIHDDHRYMIYHTLGDGTDIVFLVWIPFPVPDFDDEYNDSALHCLRFEIDTDNKVRKYKIKSGGWIGMFTSDNINLKCLDFFWNDNEIRSFQSFTEPKLIQRAENGASEAQLELYRTLVVNNPRLALNWLCKSADQGNTEAAYRIGRYFEFGNDRWDKWSASVSVQTDFVQAYVWYTRTTYWYPSEHLPSFVERRLSPEEHARAKKAASEWKPGQCERDIVLIQDIQ